VAGRQLKWSALFELFTLPQAQISDKPFELEHPQFTMPFSSLGPSVQTNSTGELYRLDDRYLIAKFNANFCG
jgi:hypothetical protein